APGMKRSGRCENERCKFLRKDGGVENLSLTARTLSPDDGMGDITLAVLSPVYSSEQVSEALRQSQERFFGTFKSAPHGIALVAPDGRWLAVNKALCDLTGYSEQELLDIDFQTITHPEDLSIDLSLVKKTLSGEVSSYQMEKRFFHKDGQTIWVLLSVYLVRDSNGTPVQFVSQIFDLTEQKETAAQLFQAQKLEAIGQLTGGIAHDFNNLLTVISGNMELLQATMGSSAATNELVEAILRAIQRGGSLTQRLLAFSRKQILKPQPTDVNALIDGIGKLLGRTLGEDVGIDFNPHDDLWYATIDASQLESAIINLAVNARDAMPGGGTLSIETSNTSLDEHYASLHSEVVPGDYVMIAVSDTGCGMARDVLERAFEPFFTTKDVGRGSGLGLSMIYGFAKQSGGHVKMYSEPGNGTVVKLFLPRSLEEPASAVPEQTTLGLEALGKTVLLVEDDYDVLHFVEKILDNAGFEVFTARSGVDALVILEKLDDLDVLLTDFILEGNMKGNEVARCVREKFEHTKVLYMTGYTERTSMHQFNIEEAATILTKPFTSAQLIERIKLVV
ncbi:MAG: PAS domain S-box protein, partial [Gammaproteobacteria bacterium]|nr:PAS domain S-box protein [Gammaproteobacteria bacterium]